MQDSCHGYKLGCNSIYRDVCVYVRVCMYNIHTHTNTYIHCCPACGVCDLAGWWPQLSQEERRPCSTRRQQLVCQNGDNGKMENIPLWWYPNCLVKLASGDLIVPSNFARPQAGEISSLTSCVHPSYWTCELQLGPNMNTVCRYILSEMHNNLDCSAFLILHKCTVSAHPGPTQTM